MKRCFCYLLTLVLGSLAVGGLVFALLRTDVLTLTAATPTALFFFAATAAAGLGGLLAYLLGGLLADRTPALADAWLCCGEASAVGALGALLTALITALSTASGVGLHIGAAPLDDDKCDTVDDQGDGHGDVIVKLRIEPIVQQEPDDCRRQDADDDLEPQVPDPALFLLRLILAEGPQALPEQQHHRQDRPQLDDNLKHVPKLFGNIKLDKIIQQDQMSR